jgi:hypothetical protein
MSRGSCRDTVDGEAKAVRVWLMHYDGKVCDLVSKIMPGVVWRSWSPALDPTGVAAVADQRRDWGSGLREGCVSGVGFGSISKRSTDRCALQHSGEWWTAVRVD